MQIKLEGYRFKKMGQLLRTTPSFQWQNYKHSHSNLWTICRPKNTFHKKIHHMCTHCTGLQPLVNNHGSFILFHKRTLAITSQMYCYNINNHTNNNNKHITCQSYTLFFHSHNPYVQLNIKMMTIVSVFAYVKLLFFCIRCAPPGIFLSFPWITRDSGTWKYIQDIKKCCDVINCILPP